MMKMFKREDLSFQFLLLVVGGPLIIIGTVLFFSWAFSPWVWKQKLTVTLHTPAGEISSQVVSQVEWVVSHSDGDSLISQRTRSECAFFELPGGRMLFVLLAPGSLGQHRYSNYVSGLLIRALSRMSADDFPVGRRTNFYGVMQHTEEVEVPRELYPAFAMFRKFGDPSSLIEVRPQDFGKVLGEGYAIKSVRVQITDEAVTDGRLAEVLPDGFLQALGSLNEAQAALPVSHDDAQLQKAMVTPEMFEVGMAWLR